MIKFDTGIPMPSGAISEAEKTLNAMKPKQSFPVKTENERKRYLMVASRHGIKIKTRKENGKGFRIWRLG